MIARVLDKELRAALPEKLPVYSPRGSGCIPAGTEVWTPRGPVRVEELREGDAILAVGERASVARIYTSRAAECLRIDGRLTCTPTQPLFEQERGWLPAGELSPGMALLDHRLGYLPIRQIVRIRGYFAVFDLTTDRASHSYVANGVVCHNKKPLRDDWR
jgi:hypothetical protein